MLTQIIEVLNSLYKYSHFSRDSEKLKEIIDLMEKLGKDVKLKKEVIERYDYVDYNDIADGVMDLSSDAVESVSYKEEMLKIDNKEELENTLLEELKKLILEKLKNHKIDDKIILYLNLMKEEVNPLFQEQIAEFPFFEDYVKFQKELGIYSLNTYHLNILIINLLKELGLPIFPEEVLNKNIRELKRRIEIKKAKELIERAKQTGVLDLCVKYWNLVDQLNEKKREKRNYVKEVIKEMLKIYKDDIIFNREIPFREKEYLLIDKFQKLGLEVSRIFFDFKNKEIKVETDDTYYISFKELKDPVNEDVINYFIQLNNSISSIHEKLESIRKEQEKYKNINCYEIKYSLELLQKES